MKQHHTQIAHTEIGHSQFAILRPHRHWCYVLLSRTAEAKASGQKTSWSIHSSQCIFSVITSRHSVCYLYQQSQCLWRPQWLKRHAFGYAPFRTKSLVPESPKNRPISDLIGKHPSFSKEPGKSCIVNRQIRVGDSKYSSDPLLMAHVRQLAQWTFRRRMYDRSGIGEHATRVTDASCSLTGW